MTYVVVESCIKCKYMDCVEVCPVDCFYEGENMLVIHPDECIDCGVCEPECPVDAIKPDTEPGLEKWLELNAEYSKTWANITVKKEASSRCQGLGGRSGQVQKVLLSERGNRRLRPWLRYPARDFAVAGGRVRRRALTDSRKSPDCVPGMAGLQPHKALILPKNVLYM